MIGFASMMIAKALSINLTELFSAYLWLSHQC
jgi:hypothetical protein